jgi:hypothetical protein
MVQRLLRVVGQPLHVVFMAQAAYFRLMRKHGVPPFVFVGVSVAVGRLDRLSRRAFSFREGCVFRTPRTAPIVRTDDLSKERGATRVTASRVLFDRGQSSKERTAVSPERRWSLRRDRKPEAAVRNLNRVGHPTSLQSSAETRPEMKPSLLPTTHERVK